MRVLLAGATGVVGRPLVPRLRAAGHEVIALTRQAAAAEALRAEGVIPVVASVFDADAVRAVAIAHRPDAVVHQLTALPRRIDPRKLLRDLGPTNRLRTEGTANLIAAAKAGGATRFVAQSLAFVAVPGEGLADEDVPLVRDAPAGGFREMVDAVVTLEAAVIGSGLTGTVLRYGHFYGPGTVFARDGSLVEDLFARRLPVVGSGDGVWSPVHVDDAATAVIAALDGPGGVFHVCDDTPAPTRELLPAVAAAYGAPRPWWVPAWLARPFAGPYASHLMTAMRGASNARAKDVLGWRPARPSWRTEIVRAASGRS